MILRIWCDLLSVFADATLVAASADGRSFFDRLWSGTVYYLAYYRDFLLSQWQDMTPMRYGALLVSIGVLGWFLMKNGPKRV
ncbi:MAG: hypothetical protein WD066_11300 [Planctomycetaceae bacterium]